MTDIDIVSVAIAGGAPALKKLAAPLPDSPVDGPKKDSIVRRVLRAAYRSWVRGGAMVDALHRSTNDARHSFDTAGATFQYYGGSSAFGHSAASAREKFEPEHQTLRKILGAQEQFGRSEKSTQPPMKKAS